MHRRIVAVAMFVAHIEEQVRAAARVDYGGQPLLLSGVAQAAVRALQALYLHLKHVSTNDLAAHNVCKASGSKNGAPSPAHRLKICA